MEKQTSTFLFISTFLRLLTADCWKCSHFHLQVLEGLDMEMEAPVHTVPASAVRLQKGRVISTTKTLKVCERK